MAGKIIKDGPRVLLIRFGQIGNALVAVPAIRALRNAWPDARLAMVADPLTYELLAPCPYLDEFIVYDSRGPQKAGPGYVKFIARLRREKFTHALHFRSYIRSQLIGFLSGAPVRIGFGTDEFPQLLNRVIEYSAKENIIEQNLKLVRELGVEAADRTLEYWPDAGSKKVAELLGNEPADRPLVVLHPAGVTHEERMWPGFGELARELKSRLNARIVMIGSPSEKGLVYKTAGEADVKDIAIGWPLPEVAELIKRADLFAGLDSGPSHLADAVGTGGAIIYAPHCGLKDHLEKWKPESGDFLAFTPGRDCRECPENPCAASGRDCDNCDDNQCPMSRQARCASEIEARRVADGLVELYERAAQKRG